MTLKKLLQLIKLSILPILVGIYPTIFLYNNNVSILNISSLRNMVFLHVVIAIVLYFLFLLFHKFEPLKSAIAAGIFLVFFNVYGIVYTWLFKLDKVQVEHYTLLPLLILFALYAGWWLTRLRTAHLLSLWKSSVLILGFLIGFNLVRLVPVEIEKGKMLQTNTPVNLEAANPADMNHPDIYYIVFDEFAGFDVMREYWGYQEIDQFVESLSEKGFFIAENSQGSSQDTLHQLSTRLNYEVYPTGKKQLETYFNDIADSRAARYLESLGYTTVVFDQTRSSFAYPAKRPVNADYLFEAATGDSMSSGGLFDDFGILVANNTMLRAFAHFYEINNPILEQHKDMVYFTMNKVANMEDIPSPRFVYIHLMLPHMPFMFDANGNYVDAKFHANWNYYLGNYIFATRVAETLVTEILSDADPNRPPVIILQSDHGARNKVTGDPNSVGLQDYPEEYKTHIMFAMYMPGYDFSTVPQDVDPINTFPIVFNYLFDANIPLQQDIHH